MIIESRHSYIISTDVRDIISRTGKCWRSKKLWVGTTNCFSWPGDYEKLLAELQAKYSQTWPKRGTNQHFDPITHLKPKYLKFKKLETPLPGFPDKPRRGWVCYGVITGKIYSNQLHFDAREASWAAHPEIWVKKEIEAEIEKEKKVKND